MKKSFLILTSILLLGAEAFAGSRCFVNARGEPLQVGHLEIHLHASMPTDLWPVIEDAVAAVNDDVGGRAFTLSRHVVDGLVDKDGVSTISFSLREESRLNARTRAYWVGHRFTEVDVVVTPQNADRSERAFRRSVEKQLRQLICD